MAQVHWVPDIDPLRLAILPRPRGGDWLADEVSAWSRAGISTMVSLLGADEIEVLELAEEEALCQAQGIEFVSFPIQDRGVPESAAEFLALCGRLAAQARSGRGVAIHCRAGIGRSGLTAACVLVELGLPAASVFEMLSRARGLDVPDTPIQVAWFEAHAGK